MDGLKVASDMENVHFKRWKFGLVDDKDWQVCHQNTLPPTSVTNINVTEKFKTLHNFNVRNGTRLLNKLNQDLEFLFLYK